MASSSHCTASLRLLRQQLRSNQPIHLSPKLLHCPERQTNRTRLPLAPQPHHRTSRPFSLHHSLSSAQPVPKVNPTPSPNPPATASSTEKFFEPDPPVSPALKIAAEVRKRASASTETYVAYGICEILVQECARQADYTIPQAEEKGGGKIPKSKNGEDFGMGKGWWYEELGLTPTFNTWAQITFLHMYLLTVRLRAFPPTHAPTWHQHLLDHFFYLAEDRMVRLHNVHARAVRNRYLKDLFVQWRGLMAGYDEGLARGEDAVLATAVWRNVFGGDEEVDFRGVGVVVSYILGVLNGLDKMEDEGLSRGEVVFGDPGGEREGVLRRSRMLEGVQGEVKGASEGEKRGGEWNKSGN